MTKNERLSNEYLSQVRERVEEASESPWLELVFLGHAREDVTKLLAEIDRLRAELAELCPIGELDTITSLRTEIEYLREQLAKNGGDNE